MNMENALCKDLPVGVYRTHDEIRNLKIRVKVKKIANACFAARDSLELQDPDEIELVNLIKSSSALVERTVVWQEKVDKKSENHVEREKETVTIIIFTYVDSDILSEEWRMKRSITHPALKLNYLENSILKTKPKARMHFQDFETWQKPPYSFNKDIVKKQNNSKYSSLPIGQSMLIMAALFFEDSSTPEEIELVSLHFDDYGTLTVIPDFCKNKTFSFLNSRSETFEYEFENVSGVLKEVDVLREKAFLRKIELQKRKVISDAVGLEFTQLADNSISFSINCEIMSAKNFHQDIFVHYLVVLPKEWNSESALEGTTETCRCKRIDQDVISYFGYTFSLDVNTTKDIFLKSTIPLLKIIIEVTSVDYWGNFRNEGYGYSNIVLAPGTETTDIFTWKLEPTTLKSRLHHFFIGGILCLEDLSYVINPKETKDSQLSKYGVQTISSGRITFKSSIIRQNRF